MAKCGHDICPDTRCGLRFPFNGGKRGECNRIKGCFEQYCSSLKAMGPSGFALYDVCLGHCHVPRTNPNYPGQFHNVDAYLCKSGLFDPVTLVDYFGVNPCAVPEEKTKVGQAQAKESSANWLVIAALVVFVGLIAAFFWALFIKK